MRPATVHAFAQLIRHTRGLLTTIEKWVGATPPDALAGEILAVVEGVRHALTDLNTALGTSRPDAAPLPTSPVTADRPAADRRPPDLQP